MIGVRSAKAAAGRCRCVMSRAPSYAQPGVSADGPRGRNRTQSRASGGWCDCAPALRSASCLACLSKAVDSPAAPGMAVSTHPTTTGGPHDRSRRIFRLQAPHHLCGDESGLGCHAGHRGARCQRISESLDRELPTERRVRPGEVSRRTLGIQGRHRERRAAAERRRDRLVERRRGPALPGSRIQAHRTLSLGIHGSGLDAGRRARQEAGRRIRCQVRLQDVDWAPHGRSRLSDDSDQGA